jgi:hypothetical protein
MEPRPNSRGHSRQVGRGSLCAEKLSVIGGRGPVMKGFWNRSATEVEGRQQMISELRTRI